MSDASSNMNIALKQQIMEKFNESLKIRRANREKSDADAAAAVADGTFFTKYYQTKSETESFTYFSEEDVNDARENLELQLLLSEARRLRSKHGPEKERRTCIFPGGKPVTWTELSSGYSWIGVKGTDTTCVVSLSNPVWKRPDGMVQLPCHAALRGALADMLGDTKSSYHGKIPQSNIAGPLAVVSAAPCLPGQECQQASRAINFLMKKLKDCSTLSSKETQQTAICALMYLLDHKFNPDNIEINGWGKYSGVIGRMSKKHVLRAIKQGSTMDLTNSDSSISFEEC